MKYYISGCVFSARFPELSKRIREYAANRHGITVLRCCVSQWKEKAYEEKMPEGTLRDSWKALKHSEKFTEGDEVWSLCHNCSNIIEEQYQGVKVHTFWELIDSDKDFKFPDYSDMTVTVQDCWRSRERVEEQKAVRSLLRKMNINFVEAELNHENTDFCGVSLLEPPMKRNAMLAPKHYVEQAEGKFIPHTEEEKKRIMTDYCRQFKTDTVVCYCHYCLEGLLLGGANGIHLAGLLFPCQ